jgi:hypothetical protein
MTKSVGSKYCDISRCGAYYQSSWEAGKGGENEKIVFFCKK